MTDSGGSHENLCDDIFDALELAKKAHNLLPPLPPDIKPVYLRVLKAVARVRNEDGYARVSDINAALGFLSPNTTKLINELQQLGVVTKRPLETDRRVVLVQATGRGEQYIQQYIVKYTARLMEAFEEVGVQKCHVMVETIAQVYQVVQKIYQQSL